MPTDVDRGNVAAWLQLPLRHVEWSHRTCTDGEWRALSWKGPFTVPAGGDVSVHFASTVSTTVWTYFSDATATAGRLTVRAATGRPQDHAGTDSATHAPVATGQAVNMDQDTPVQITLGATDADHDPLTFSIVGSPTHGTLGGGRRQQVTYTPAAWIYGAGPFAFKASDGTHNATPRRS